MKFRSNYVEAHNEVPAADEGQLDDVLQQWAKRRASPESSPVAENACYVLSVHRGELATTIQAQLRELVALVEAQGDRVVGTAVQPLQRPDPRTLLRSGVAERVAAQAKACGANMLVVDAELSPSQARNLEDVTGLPICDREAVILNVFQRHATTRRARIQVELAHLEYLRPRIRGLGLNMDQQTGGLVKARGPGETASELLARRLDGRVAELRRQLARVDRAAVAQRKHRGSCQRVVLVGYTNAGKSSLMNALTAAELAVRDRPFETLDTTSRCLTRHGGDVLLSDTVGFIRNLPQRLYASFESTLAEVAEASLLLLVVDSSDVEAAQHVQTTWQVLERLNATHIPRLWVFNKQDRRGATALDLVTTLHLSEQDPVALVSAHDPDSVGRLGEQLLSLVRSDDATQQLWVPYVRGDVLSLIYGRCRVLKSVASATGTQLEVSGKAHVIAEVRRMLREGGL